MTVHRTTAPIEFCTEGELGYERSRTRFIPGEGIAFDEAYRLAQCWRVP